MKTKILFVILLALLFGVSPTAAQGFKPPAEGKAVIYFTPIYKVPKYKFFHNEKYIGIINKRNYIRYECEPGQHLFWASSGNKEFITADLKEGETYLVIVVSTFNILKYNVGFVPYNYYKDEHAIWGTIGWAPKGTSSSDKDSKKILKKAKKIIVKKPSNLASNSEAEEENARLQEFIKEQLVNYNEEWKHKQNFKHISPDMALPEEAMK